MTKRKIESWVIPPEQDAEFVACREEVLETYAEAYDPKHPVLCRDEQPVQWRKETRVEIPATKEHGNFALHTRAIRRELTRQIAIALRRAPDKLAQRGRGVRRLLSGGGRGSRGEQLRGDEQEGDHPLWDEPAAANVPRVQQRVCYITTKASRSGPTL